MSLVWWFKVARARVENHGKHGSTGEAGSSS